MGRKKGKQSNGFRSKAERGRFARTVQQTSAVGEVWETEEKTTARAAAVADTTRPTLAMGTLSSLRSFLAAAPSAPRTTLSVPTAAPAASRFPDFSSPPALPAASKLAELCADVIGKTFSCYDLDLCDTFDFMPPEVVSRISHAASFHSQLNDGNAPLLFTSTVGKLTLYGDLSPQSLSVMFPQVVSCNRAVVGRSALGGEAPPGSTGGNGDWEQLGEHIPDFLQSTGCANITSLSLNSPRINGSIIAEMPRFIGLQELSLVACRDGDGKAPTSLLSALPQLLCLKVLDLRSCAWMNDDVLEEVLPLLPVSVRHRVEIGVRKGGELVPLIDSDRRCCDDSSSARSAAAETWNMSVGSHHLVARVNLRRLVVSGTAVTLNGARRARAWQEVNFSWDESGLEVFV